MIARARLAAVPASCGHCKRPRLGALSPARIPAGQTNIFVGVTPAGVRIIVTSGSQRVLAADVRALGIPCLGAQDALAGKRPEIPLDELPSGRAKRLLALMDRWIEDVRTDVRSQWWRAGQPESSTVLWMS